MKAHMPLILRQNDHNAYLGGILGLSPEDGMSGPLFVNYLND